MEYNCNVAVLASDSKEYGHSDQRGNDDYCDNAPEVPKCLAAISSSKSVNSA
jgi:hypothetical protein